MCFDVPEEILSGRGNVILQLIREWSLFKSGVGDPQHKKENGRKSYPEQSEFLYRSSGLEVPGNFAGGKTGTSKEKSLQGVADLPWVAHHTPNGCPWDDHALALPLLCNETSSTDSLPWFLLHHCLYSAPNLLALLPASPCQSHTWSLDRFGHVDIWHLVWIWFELTLWHPCLWLSLHLNSGVQCIH